MLRRGGGGWIRKPRTEKQPTGLFSPACGQDVLFSSHPPVPQPKTPPPGLGDGVSLVEEGGFASRALENSPLGCFPLPAGRTCCSHLTLPYHNRKPHRRGSAMGFRWWRRVDSQAAHWKTAHWAVFPCLRAGRAVLISPSVPQPKTPPPGLGDGVSLVEEGGFEPPKSLTTDLQSAPFGHSGTPPY